MKNILILGANSDVARQAIVQYVKRGDHVTAASRSTHQLEQFISLEGLDESKVEVGYFDAVDFASHAIFYRNLKKKPHIIVYAAGYLLQNEKAFYDFEGAFQMMKVHYCGAVSILNIAMTDRENPYLERIVGLSSLSGVRGRKSNFIYGSTKSAFTQYLAGLRQELASRNIIVNVIVAGYIRSKMTAGLDLPESLMLEPEFIANSVVNPPKRFIIVPGFKWKLIYQILKRLPEGLVAKLP